MFLTKLDAVTLYKVIETMYSTHLFFMFLHLQIPWKWPVLLYIVQGGGFQPRDRAPVRVVSHFSWVARASDKHIHNYLYISYMEPLLA